MEKSINAIPHVVIREIFETVDLKTLFKCRRVCHSWNNEIESMKYKRTQKLNIERMLLGIGDNHISIEGTSKSCYYAHSFPKFIGMIRHFESPNILLLFVRNHQNGNMIDSIINGLNIEWCENVKELEIGDLGNISTDKINQVIWKFSNIYYLNISWKNQESVSCSMFLRSLQKLRFLRIYQNLENDNYSNGLFLDNESLDILITHQINNSRLLQHIELWNMKITFTNDEFMNFLTKLSTIPVHQDVLTTIPKCVNAQIDEIVYISFLSCQFENPILTNLQHFCSENVYSFRIAQTSFEILID
ncbi:unnamed protein product [Caenorhabditis angaria]|uniref:F-box domain-containing protein n=1 Tax=Caenorhabditis angaria TaxID=860376 RepID=A0A9P1IBU7_9PELO|nr:unnamed protein product [Caenorhabditis angaria]